MIAHFLYLLFLLFLDFLRLLGRLLYRLLRNRLIALVLDAAEFPDAHIGIDCKDVVLKQQVGVAMFLDKIDQTQFKISQNHKIDLIEVAG